MLRICITLLVALAFAVQVAHADDSPSRPEVVFTEPVIIGNIGIVPANTAGPTWTVFINGNGYNLVVSPVGPYGVSGCCVVAPGAVQVSQIHTWGTTNTWSPGEQAPSGNGGAVSSQGSGVQVSTNSEFADSPHK